MINSDRLRGLLVEHRMNQEDGAKIIGLSARQFSRRLSKSDFWVSELEKLASALEVQPADLLKNEK